VVEAVVGERQSLGVAAVEVDSVSLPELRPRLLELVDTLVQPVDVVGVLEQPLGAEPGATADVEHAVALLDAGAVERLVAHLLVPDERVDLVVHLREVLVEQPRPSLVLQNSHWPDFGSGG
jgi:hypothetical protein